jgi:triosephosphate isomerase
MQDKAPQQRRTSASLRSASHRVPLIAANWKMNKTVAEAVEFVDRFAASAESVDGIAAVLCPPFTALAAVVERTRETAIEVAAQNMHDQPSGAFTGEVSAPMLVEAGAWGVILGHSERRQLFGETDEAIARKLVAALDAGLVPILCVGESEAERDADETEAVLERQLAADLAALDAGRLAEVVIAYEPIWAIGTGRTATPEQAQEAIAFIRAQLDPAASAAVRILYGGSVKPDNAAELFAKPDIDGGLVGGASLDPEGFAAICAAAGTR